MRSSPSLGGRPLPRNVILFFNPPSFSWYNLLVVSVDMGDKLNLYYKDLKTCSHVFLSKLRSRVLSYVFLLSILKRLNTRNRSRFFNVIICDISICCKILWFNLDGTWCGRRLSHVVCDSHGHLIPSIPSTPRHHHHHRPLHTKKFLYTTGPRPSCPKKNCQKHHGVTSNKEGGSDDKKDSEKTRS
jgi:hypothetical protein